MKLLYPDRAVDFDKKVEPNLKQQSEIEDYLKENTGDKVGDEFAEGIAQDLAEMRESDSDDPVEFTNAGDMYYDNEANMWRDSETGQFVSDDDI